MRSALNCGELEHQNLGLKSSAMVVVSASNAGAVQAGRALLQTTFEYITLMSLRHDVTYNRCHSDIAAGFLIDSFDFAVGSSVVFKLLLFRRFLSTVLVLSRKLLQAPEKLPRYVS